MLKRNVFLTTATLLSAITIGYALTDEEPLIDPAELPVLEPTDLMSQETMRVIEMLETLHFNTEEISDEAFIELIREFMSKLDYNHTVR